MKALLTHCASFILFLSITTSFCQNSISTENINDLSVTTINTNEGNVQVLLPKISHGQTISGTVMLEPNGKNDKKTNKNLEKLKQLTLSIGKVSIPLNDTSFTFSASSPELSIALKNEGKTVASGNISIASDPANCSSICFPNYVTASSYSSVNGTVFDGNACSDCVTLSGNPVAVIAESENMLIVRIPEGLQGRQMLSITEDQNTYEQDLNVLQLSLSVGQLNLLRGQQTDLSITVFGFEGLDESIPLELTNNSQNNISLQDGNAQEILIVPSENPSGVFQSVQTIRAIDNGSFSISANIQPSDPNQDPNNEQLCTCKIGDDLFLIQPEACEELGGQCHTGENNSPPIERTQVNVTPSLTFHGILISIDDDIADAEEDILEEWEKWDKAKGEKDEADENHNDLVAIDEILDKVPGTYQDKLKRIVDSLANAKRDFPDGINHDVLQNAVANAEARVKACEEHLETLKKQAQDLEEQLEEDEEAVKKIVDEMSEILDDYGCKNGPCKATVTFEDGKAKIDYNFPKNSMDAGDQQLFDELIAEYYKRAKAYKDSHKKHKQTLDAIEDAEDDCKDLSDALDKAKEAKDKADAAAAIEQEAEAICDEIKRLLKQLERWCKNNPDHCDFLKDIEDLLKQCPKTDAELDDFWDAFDDLLKKKKALEDDFAKQAEDAQGDMDEAEDTINDLKGEIDNLEQEKREDQARKDQIKRDKAAAAKAEADEARARAAAAKKKKRERDKKDKEVKDIIKKAKSHEGADEVLGGYIKDLIMSLSLDELDKASGDAKIGKLLGAILTAKEIPECACKLYKALKEALAAHNRGEDPFVYANEFIRHFKDCADLPHISTIMEGAQQLSEAIQSLTPAQTKQALEGITRVIRIQECK
ncbi:hypothetical protein [Winogradskyella sp. 3972H.M.0a.05]|uniref:hypothetical protein n=1 Tax=Winogradskyella sp. 3972H.M.0a.05 TaxID=2950277 RepID=UPI0033926EBD